MTEHHHLGHQSGVGSRRRRQPPEHPDRAHVQHPNQHATDPARRSGTAAHRPYEWVFGAVHGWYIADRTAQQQYRSPQDRGVFTDYGYIGRLPKPDGRGTFLYLAGIHSQGTLGAAKYVADNLLILYRQMKTRRFSAVVACSYNPDARTQPSVFNVRLETPCYRHDAN
jgi:hypothetical protein